MTEEETENEELQIVRPEDFRLNKDRFFTCPKCKSKAIALNPKFKKNNIVNSLDGEKDNRACIVLICVNCDHVDVLDSFICDMYEGLSFNPSRRKKYISPKPYRLFTDQNLPAYSSNVMSLK